VVGGMVDALAGVELLSRRLVAMKPRVVGACTLVVVIKPRVVAACKLVVGVSSLVVGL